MTDTNYNEADHDEDEANIPNRSRTLSLSDLLGGFTVDSTPITESLRIIGEQYQRQMSDSLKIIARPLPLPNIGDIFRESLSPITISFQANLKPIIEGLSKQLVSFREVLERISAAEAKRLAKTLCDYHWWPVPGLPDEFYDGILNLIASGNVRSVNQYICTWFSWWRHRRLGRMVRRWKSNKSFARRHAIYTQALNAHRRGWYNVSIPTLLPLIEGIAIDYLKEEHSITERGKEAIKKALGNNMPSNVFEEELRKALIQFLAESTFVNTYTGNVLPSGYQLNRHGVLHGKHLRYGTEANSLRCFLWLETLYHCIDDNPIEVDWNV